MTTSNTSSATAREVTWRGYDSATCSSWPAPAVIETAAVPYLDGARRAVRDGYISGGTRRNLAWVMRHADPGSVAKEDLLLLPARRPPAGCWSPEKSRGNPVIGELIAPGHHSPLLR